MQIQLVAWMGVSAVQGWRSNSMDVAAMREAEQEEVDEQGEIEEVSKQCFNEMCRSYSDWICLTRFRHDVNVVQTVLYM